MTKRKKERLDFSKIKRGQSQPPASYFAGRRFVSSLFIVDGVRM